MKNPIVGMKKVALQNRLRKHVSPDLDFSRLCRTTTPNSHLANGCSGYITNTANGKIAYLTTEKCCYGPLSNKVMHREAIYQGAKNSYHHGQNIWSDSEKEFYRQLKRTLGID